MAGILFQYFKPFSLIVIDSIILTGAIGLILYSFISLSSRYFARTLPGICVHIFLLGIGAFLIYANDIRNNKQWYDQSYKEGDAVLVRLEEPLVEKAKTYKALASVLSTQNNKDAIGKVILYFQKDSTVSKLSYGSLIQFNRALARIKNSGNPGSFDYESYCFRQGIVHQAYLTPKDIIDLHTKDISPIKDFAFNTRAKIVRILQKYLKASREQGLIEAMFIGYKDDLDKDLSQSYTNTGVIHLIAISGLHLALIYGLLLWITKPLKRFRFLSIIRILFIIASLWLFSIMAGGQASVIRSAVMLTCIIGAELLNRKTYIINTLACSAFLLLCYNPYWLWDIGFQLSYAAVLSLVLFMQPVYKLLYFPNKIIDAAWKLVAVTIAAQLLTTPISIYYFHQFPNLFLVTNIIAVPLSGFVLYGAIALCAFSFVPFLAHYIGIAEEWLIRCLNDYIARMDDVSIALWSGLQISLVQTMLLLITISTVGYCLLRKNKKALWIGLSSLFLFSCLRSIDLLHARQQQTLIVYNIYKHKAISIFNGRKETFITDADPNKDAAWMVNNIQPARSQYRITATNTYHSGFNILANTKTIATPESLSKVDPTHPIDVLVLSDNNPVSLNYVFKHYIIGQVVLDSSVPSWMADTYKNECIALHMPCYTVAEKGAFVMNL